MTLMPVSNIWVFDSSWSNAGALRWMPHRSLTSSFSPSSRFRHSPRVLKTWPRVASPTGTVIGPPVSLTCAPRTRPSVGCSEIARTMPSPMCWATSSDSVRVSPASVSSVSSRLYMSGIESTGNSMSTTGPMTRAIRPPVPSVAVLFSSAVAVMSLNSLTVRRWLFGRSVGVGQGVHATDDLADFLGDARLPGLVGDTGVLLDQLFGVVSRRLHGPLARGQLRGRRLEQREEDAALDVLGEQGVQHLGRRRLELVERQHLVLRRPLVALDDLHRQHPHVVRLLHQHRAELRVEQVDVVDVARGVLVGDEGLDQRLADLLGVLVAGLVGEPAPRLRHRTPPEAVVRLALAAGEVGDDLLALATQALGEPLALLEHARGVGAGQTPVARHDQDRGGVGALRLGGQRVRDVGVGDQRLHGPGQLASVRRALLSPLLRLDDPGRSDELHGARDLLGRLDRLDPGAVPTQRYGHPSAPLLLDDLLLLELLVGHRLGLGLRAGLDRLALGGLELVEELVVGGGDLLLGGVVELAALTDLVEDALVLAVQEVEELLLEAQHVVGRDLVELPRRPEPQRDRHLRQRVR